MMEEHGGFNHNHQSYRVVTELERRYPNWHGLNLSYEALEGIAKHETDYDVSEAGGFDAEKRGSLEAQIADVADELAYNAHDLDDGLQSGLIKVSQLQELSIWQQVVDNIQWQGDELSDLDRHRAIRDLVGIEVDEVITQTHKRLEALDIQSVDDVQAQTMNLVDYSNERKQQNRDLKAFLYENMYRHFRVVRMQERAEHFISQLFQSYIKEPRQLPPEYYQRIEHNGLHRVVADYIAGMTDRSALLEYRRLFDPTMRP
jgi:dGTPase